MTATVNRPLLSQRLAGSKVIAVLRTSQVSALAPVCDVLVEEGILSLELTLTTPDLLDAHDGGELSALRDRCRAVRAVVAATAPS